jgi:hypothetical protein
MRKVLGLAVMLGLSMLALSQRAGVALTPQQQQCIRQCYLEDRSCSLNCTVNPDPAACDAQCNSELAACKAACLGG